MAIRLGIIGCGSIGKVHAEAALAAGQTITGCCDREPQRSERLAAACGGAFATDSHAALLARRDIDAVVIAVPNFQHAPLAIAAMSAGKDVLLEKPMAMNVEECDQVIQAAQRTQRIVQMGFVTRYSPTSLAVADFICAGWLGNVYHAKAMNVRRRGIPGLGRWFTTRAQSGGGALIDLGVHLIDLVMHLTGRPLARSVSGQCISAFGQSIDNYVFTDMWAGPPDPQGAFDVEDSANGLMRFANGMTLDISVAWASNVPEDSIANGVTLFGDRGGCTFEPTGQRLLVASQRDRYVVDLSPKLSGDEPWPAAFRRQHEVFAQCVQARSQPPATMSHGREVQAIIEAFYRSAGEAREMPVIA